MSERNVCSIEIEVMLVLEKKDSIIESINELYDMKLDISKDHMTVMKLLLDIDDSTELSFLPDCVVVSNIFNKGIIPFRFVENYMLITDYNCLTIKQKWFIENFGKCVDRIIKPKILSDADIPLYKSLMKENEEKGDIYRI